MIKPKILAKWIIRKYPILIRVFNKIYWKNGFNMSKRNSLECDSAVLAGVKVVVRGENNRIHIGCQSYMKNCTIYINGSNNDIIIGKKVSMNKVDIVVENSNNQINVDDECSFCARILLAVMEETKILIGKHCMFSTDIQLRTGDSHVITDSSCSRINYSEDIIIGNHVWIGTRVVLLKSVVIPDACIIGACSLVTKQFAEGGCVIGGNPAKVIKKEVNWIR